MTTAPAADRSPLAAGGHRVHDKDDQQGWRAPRGDSLGETPCEKRQRLLAKDSSQRRLLARDSSQEETPRKRLLFRGDLRLLARGYSL